MINWTIVHFPDSEQNNYSQMNHKEGFCGPQQSVCQVLDGHDRRAGKQSCCFSISSIILLSRISAFEEKRIKELFQPYPLEQKQQQCSFIQPNRGFRVKPSWGLGWKDMLHRQYRRYRPTHTHIQYNYTVWILDSSPGFNAISPPCDV